MSDGCVGNCPSSTSERRGAEGKGGGRGDECIGKGKGSFAISLGGGGGLPFTLTTHKI